ncbi:protein lethal(2)essential for life-like [Chrysoperla carnea]|uniref:protein lethal(2)essential for life-like n=1 Tax=Chrysoperla carnea TaxID=189513 RepID=UPI001D08DBEE|nr:protein lethal(2)essential for life-like [Chrysoperla carnea]
MSLVPMVFRDFWSELDRLRSSRFNRDWDVDNLVTPFNRLYRPPSWVNELSHWDSGATITNDKDAFKVNIDVQQFTPQEITVKTVDNNTIVVEGKHEEKRDEHGFVSRQFTRRYVLPDGHDVNNIVSTLSSDGVLTVTAPKLPEIQSNERVIPITQTGTAAKVVEKKAEE